MEDGVQSWPGLANLEGQYGLLWRGCGDFSTDAIAWSPMRTRHPPSSLPTCPQAEAAVAQSGLQRRSMRAFLRDTLHQLTLLFKDCPGPLPPKLVR